MVDVLIRQIHAAGKPDPPIDDEDLPVVAVVVVGRDKGLHRAEHLALDAQRFQPLGVVPRQGRELAGAVVYHPHVHALGGLAGQNLQHPAPEQPLVDDEIFDEDVLFRRIQLPQQLGKLGFAAGEIGHGGVLIHREAAARPMQILCQRRRAGLGPAQPLHHLPVLGQLGAEGIFQFHQPLAQQVVARIALDVEKKRHAHHGQDGNDHHPCDLRAVVHLAVEQIDHHGCRHDHAAAEVMGQQVAEPPEDAEQQPHLEQQKHQYQPEAAEDGVDDPLLALFQ